MPKPSVDITPGQKRVMQKLLVGYKAAEDRLKFAVENHNTELEDLGEYSAQMAEKLGIDIKSDYSFDIVTMRFIDKATVKGGGQ